MRKKIGIYEYSRVEQDQIIVFYNDHDPLEPNDKVVMIFRLIDSQVFSQGNINDPDYLEIYGNAINIFKGNIVLD